MKKVLITVAAFIAAAGITLGILAGTGVLAIFSQEKAVRLSAKDIENSTLAIGTHLIYLGSLNQEIYDIAEASAEDSQQTRIYYKSEVEPGAGTWFDITDAESITDISNGGTPVTDEVIDALYFTHHTKSDGITYDLRTNEPVGLFDINSPYDLTTLPEIDPLRLKAQTVSEIEGKTDDGKLKLALTETVTKAEVVTPDTVVLDTKLAALQKYYDVLKANDAKQEWLDAVLEVMTSIDAERRVKVFTVLDEKLTEMLLIAASGDPNGVYKAFNDLTESGQSSQENVLSSKQDYEAKILAEGDTVMTKQVYKSSNGLVSAAQAGNHSQCDVYVEELVALNNIANSTVVDKDKELAMLDQKLLVDAMNQFTTGISSGENEDYLNSVSRNESIVLQQGIRDDAYGNCKVYENELETFIEARILRIENTDAQDYIKQLITESAQMYGMIPVDFFYETSKQVVDSYITWLNNKLASLVSHEMQEDLAEIDGQIEQAQTEYLSALDNNDLTAAKTASDKRDQLMADRDSITNDMSSQLNDVDAQIDEIQKQLDALAASASGGSSSGSTSGSGTSEADKQYIQNLIDAAKSELDDLQAQQQALIGDLKPNVAAQAESTKNSIDSAIANGQSSDVIKSMTDKLIGLIGDNFVEAYPYAEPVYTALANEYNTRGTDGNGNVVDQTLKDAMDGMEQAMLDYGGKYDEASSLADQIASKSDEMKNLQDGLTTGTTIGDQSELLSKLADLQTQKATLEAGLSSTTNPTTVATGLKNDILSLLQKSDAAESDYQQAADLADQLIGLVDSDYAAVFPQLNTAYQEMSKTQALLPTASDALAGAIAAMEQCILDNKTAYDAAMQNNGMTALTPDELASKADEYLAELGKTNKLSSYEQDAVKLGAMAQYYDRFGGNELLDGVTKLATSLYQGGNPMIYYKLAGVNSVSDIYAPLKGVAYLSGMRFIKDDGGTYTIAEGAVYYRYTVNSKTYVKRGQKDTVEAEYSMTLQAKEQLTIYIPGDHIAKEYGFTASYIAGTAYGMLYTTDIAEQIQAMYEYFLV